MKHPETWCVMPFSHINIKQEGKLSACWRYPDRIGDYLTDSLTDTWNGEKLLELRRALLNGEQHPGCKSCWDLERSGVSSTRQNCINDYAGVVDYDSAMASMADDYTMPLEDITSIEIRFDNICNLMCRHCSPDYSSKWEHAVKKDADLLEHQKRHGSYRKMDYHVRLTDDMITEIGTFAPHLKQIMIAGGEPLYHDKHYAFLESLQDHAHNIVLSYNSNLNTLEYKGKSILDLWRKFKNVDIRVSIDADDEIYEYVRVHAHLNLVENNIARLQQELDNVFLNATCTTSLLNITRLPNVFRYFNRIGAYVHTSLVQYPRALNPKLLPKELKQQTTLAWQQFADNMEQEYSANPKMKLERQLRQSRRFGNSVIDYMNSEDWNEHWHEFVNYSNSLDRYHKTNILDWYPEFEPYWSKK
jgi:radical SAM protein with 4Fe4S-binding SPASM domain